MDSGVGWRYVFALAVTITTSKRSLAELSRLVFTLSQSE